MDGKPGSDIPFSYNTSEVGSLEPARTHAREIIKREHFTGHAEKCKTSSGTVDKESLIFYKPQNTSHVNDRFLIIIT